jgi:hypothetical protein
MHCLDPGRFAYFRDELSTLTKWLANSHTHPALADALSTYIFHRGSLKFQNIPDLPAELWLLAEEQDCIGWDNFMEGKISMQFEIIQRRHLLTSPSLLTATDWTKQLISKLLHLTHGQWIYRNISRHHTKLGLLKDMERRQLLIEIDRLMSVDPSEVPEESKFLLEIDFRAIRTASTERQSYWVHAVRAAIKAGRRAAKFQHRRRRILFPAAAQAEPPLGYGQRNAGEQDVPLFGGRKRPGQSGAGSVADESNKRRKPD